MHPVIETIFFAGFMVVLLSPVLLVVFLFQKRKGRSNEEAGRFVAAGAATVCAVIVAFSSLAAVGRATTDQGSGPNAISEPACQRLGGELQRFPDTDGTIVSMCIIGG